ncbi:MAG: peptide deformylase [Chloroflexi bacterium]|nr:peptide deformylase [Chloroflexota bacterium]
MAILPVRVLPDPLLRKKARRVKAIDAAIQKLAADMIETMQAGYGVGLAAPQVGVLRRVVTIQIPETEPLVMINPEITSRDGERRVREGCLSVPGWYGMVTRAVSITAEALDSDGAEYEIADATELLAQVIEHEVDHLNGIVFTDHLQAHIDLWKAGEEPPELQNGSHEHGDIDFEHEAGHDRVLGEVERDALRAAAASGSSDSEHDEMDDDREGQEGSEDPEHEEDEAAEPLVYADLSIYQQADLDQMDGELRRMQALLSGE